MANKEKDQSTDQDLSLDQDELDTDRGREKVELDLDDAPFLEEEEEELEAGEDHQGSRDQGDDTHDEDQKAPVPWWKQKKTFAAGAAALLILLLVTGYFLVSPEDEPPPPDPAPREVVDDPIEEPEKDLSEIIVDMEPFMVEFEADNNIRFLKARFSLSVLGDDMAREVQDKKLVLRDSIYYFLRNKDGSFLQNSANTDEITRDLMSVLEQYLGRDQLNNIVIEDYSVM
ncbi:flagellar basal body-associated protein FliL [Desulfonatronospira thiodismutans ASO3-1]|uniref:Flagellar protein FliL n=1 Tax=Desulfonatronospira thiodismutans ASO3-1 TaxID=555779 RepID=D6SMQ1_9BACT|nr:MULTISPECIES: flagellar basal body-associated FliL family protein [Desulfonatronospira]EFI35962.1 flagellar basal body-associated protein FliL [Desulfonatronospira thiodismutans ASO3-1]RQD79312.1 MAG: hypothetical protein D5S03_00470 [Desulfonatronospira sp. MSAO_Bac3]